MLIKKRKKYNALSYFLYLLYIPTIDIESLQNRLLKVCNVPATRAGLLKASFFQWPLTVLMNQTRQAVCAFKQSILLRCLWYQHSQRWVCSTYKWDLSSITKCDQNHSNRGCDFSQTLLCYLSLTWVLSKLT